MGFPWKNGQQLHHNSALAGSIEAMQAGRRVMAGGNLSLDRRPAHGNHARLPVSLQDNVAGAFAAVLFHFTFAESLFHRVQHGRVPT